MKTANRIIELCQTLQAKTSTEKVLQDALEPLLRANFSLVTREHQLSTKDIVDFLVDESVGLEVKTDGSWMEVTRQLMRYLEHKSVKRIVLVTTKRQHAQVPGTLRGKPVDVVWLSPL